MNNYIDNPTGPVTSLGTDVKETKAITGDVADGEADPVLLSASFDHNVGTKYQYNIKDKVKSDKAPPSLFNDEL